MKRLFGWWIGLLALAWLVSAPAGALPVELWNKNGVLVNDTPGNTLQQNPRIVEDKAGGCIMVYEDYRSGSSNIYAQKIDSSGKMLWPEGGAPICQALGDQLFPKITADSQEGAIIVWQDNRNGNFDLYAQKISSQGERLWSQDGQPVCEEFHSQASPDLISDQAGGAIVVWHDYRGPDEDIFAQRILTDGSLSWAPAGLPVCPLAGTQWYPKIAADGSGQALIAWEDRRAGNYDIYAQKLDLQGRIFWKAGGTPMIEAEGNQEDLVIEPDGQGGLWAVWSSGQGLFAQKLNAEGQLQLDPAGINISAGSLAPVLPRIAGDGQGGLCVVWSDPLAGDPDIYGRYISSSGKLVWEAIKPLARNSGPQLEPLICGQGPWIVLWREEIGAKQKLCAQKIGKDAYPLWVKEQEVVEAKGASNASMISGSGDNAWVVWQDRRNGNFDIFAQKIKPDGGRAWDQGLIIEQSPGAVMQQNLKAVGEGKDGYLAAFEDYRSGFSNIYLQKLDSAGKLLWSAEGVPAAAGKFSQKEASLVADGTGGAVVVWKDGRNESSPKIFGQRFSAAGDILWGREGLELTPQLACREQAEPELILAEGGVIVVFTENRGRLSVQDIGAQKIDLTGQLLWGGRGQVVCAAEGRQAQPAITSNLIVAWTDYREGPGNSNIYAQKLEASGKTLWDEDGLPICEAPDLQKDPAAAALGDGALVAWMDRAGGSFDIYAQKLGIDGKNAWIKDGVPVCQSARVQQSPLIVKTPQNEVVVIWEDFRLGNWDLNAQKISGGGKLLWGENGSSVCQLVGTQYAPQILPMGGSSVVVWEDYRSGSSYNIYMQALSSAGKPVWGEGGVMVKASLLGGRFPALAKNPQDTNSLVVFWEDHRRGGQAIYGQKYKF